MKVTLISGTRKGIGRHLAEYYAGLGHHVIGCSRQAPDWTLPNYRHFQLDVADEAAVRDLFATVRREFGQLDHLINNAGVAAMNHSLLTPLGTARQLLDTNVLGTFLFAREAARLMQRRRWGRIVNFSSVAVPFKLEGEAMYVAAKAAVEGLTHVLAREFGPLGVTVNAIGPGPIRTDLIRNVPPEKITALLQRQAIPRAGEFKDVVNVLDFYLRPESDFITGQIMYLGGV